MTDSKLAQLVAASVQAAVEHTIARTAEDAAEDMARELLKDPRFRARMTQLLEVAFDRALVELAQPPAPPMPIVQP